MQKYPSPPTSDGQANNNNNTPGTSNAASTDDLLHYDDGCTCTCPCPNCGYRPAPVSAPVPAPPPTTTTPRESAAADWEPSWLHLGLLILASALLIRVLFSSNYVEAIRSLKPSLSPGEFEAILWLVFYHTVFYEAGHLLATFIPAYMQARLVAKESMRRAMLEHHELSLEYEDRQSARMFQVEMQKLKSQGSRDGSKN